MLAGAVITKPPENGCHWQLARDRVSSQGAGQTGGTFHGELWVAQGILIKGRKHKVRARARRDASAAPSRPAGRGGGSIFQAGEPKPRLRGRAVMGAEAWGGMMQPASETPQGTSPPSSILCRAPTGGSQPEAEPSKLLMQSL